MADAYSADLLLPPFMYGPRLDSLGMVSLDGLTDLADDFSASLTATAIRAIRMTKQPLILVASNLLGKRWQWPSISAAGLRIRDDIDPRSSAFAVPAMAGKMHPARKDPANYWFDRRHVEQFDIQVQSVKAREGEALSLVRILDQKMIDIYG